MRLLMQLNNVYFPTSVLKVVYLSEMFDWHDAMLNDPRFSTPNCSAFLTALRIISIISTTCPIDTNKDNHLAQTWTVSYCINSGYGIESELCREQWHEGPWIRFIPVRRMVVTMNNQRSIRGRKLVWRIQSISGMRQKDQYLQWESIVSP